MQFSDAIRIHNKSKMVDGRHIENRFFGYISAPYWPINAKFGTDEASHADICHMTKTAIFANSRWRTAAILKNSIISISQPRII